MASRINIETNFEDDHPSLIILHSVLQVLKERCSSLYRGGIQPLQAQRSVELSILQVLSLEDLRPDQTMQWYSLSIGARARVTVP